MKALLSMVETTRAQGATSQKHLFAASDVDEFYDAVEKCEPFVFHEQVVSKREATEAESFLRYMKEHRLVMEERIGKINAKKSVLEDKLSEVTKQQEMVTAGLLTDEEAERLLSAEKALEDSDEQIGIVADAPFPVFSIEQFKSEDALKCLVVIEKEPRRYLLWGYFESNVGRFTFEVTDLPAAESVVQAALKLLSRHRVGYEAVRERLRVGHGDKKRMVTVRRVIHVLPTRPPEEGILQVGKHKIQFSHRFGVRGHWRKLEGRVGKNRAGDYCVHDWTWVSDFVKGPEKAPMMHKTRIVSAASEAAMRGPNADIKN